MHVSQRKVWLDTVLFQPFEMFQVKRRAGVSKHAGPSRYLFRILKMCSFNIIWCPHLGDIHHAGADGHRDALRLWRQLGQHVTGIVAQPFGLLSLTLGRKRNRAADLQDHLRHGFLQASEQVVELVKVRGQVPGGRVAHMNVQDRGAGVVAVHRGLDLFIPGDGDVGGVAWQPCRRVGCGCDDQRLHGLGV
jgi:hypothetical protein